MSKKSKQKTRGGAKSYSTSRQTGKGSAKSYQRTSGPSAQRIMTIRLAGIGVVVAAVVGALALAIPYAGEYPTGIIAALIVLGFITGLGLFAAVRAPRVAERFDAARNVNRKR